SRRGSRPRSGPAPAGPGLSRASAARWVRWSRRRSPRRRSGSGAAARSRTRASPAAPPAPRPRCRAGPAPRPPRTPGGRAPSLSAPGSLEHRLQLLVHEFGRDGPYVLEDHAAVRVHEERLRHAVEAPVDAYLAVGVEAVGEGEPELREEGAAVRVMRSEERRVGKEWSARWAPYHSRKRY